MEQNSEQEKDKFMEDLEAMRGHGIYLKISTADVQFGDDEPVLTFHLILLGKMGGEEYILMHGMCRKAKGLQHTLKNMAHIAAELCRLCAGRQIIGSPVFDEAEMEVVVKEIMREAGMDVDQLCKPQEAPEREAWMFN